MILNFMQDKFNILLALNKSLTHNASTVTKWSACMTNDDSKPTGRAKGGIARAAKLTPEQRSDIARKGAMARKNPKEDSPSLPVAEYPGVIKFGELSFPCAVLSDGSRVFTETDFMSGMGMYRSGALSVRRGDSESARIPLYLAFKNLFPYVIKHLGDVHVAQFKYKTLTGGVGHGIDASLIPKICSIWLDARKDGVLGPRQEKIANNAELLIRSLAEIGIVALVDEATGYQSARPQDALQKYLELIVRKELAAWVKKFPDEFYENIYKLKGWIWPGMGKNRYSVVGHYTRDLVFDRIAPGLLKELETRCPKDEKGNRKGKMHQLLTPDIGDPMLSQHMHALVMFQRSAIKNGYGWNKFVKMVDQVMPRRGDTLELDLLDPNVSND